MNRGSRIFICLCVLSLAVCVKAAPYRLHYMVEPEGSKVVVNISSTKAMFSLH